MALATDQNVASRTAISQTMLGKREHVFAPWEQLFCASLDGAVSLPEPLLDDSLRMVYDNLIDAITTNPPDALRPNNQIIAAAHGELRSRMTDFSVDQLILEFQLLREAIRSVAHEEHIDLGTAELTALQSAHDLALRSAVDQFVAGRSRQRRCLAACLAHDLRSPLALMQAGAQLVAKAETLETAHRGALRVQAAGRRLENMITELTDTFTVEGRERLPLVIKHFDMQVLIAEISDEFHSRGCMLDAVSESLWGYWCEKSVRRALENLIINAYKYGDGSIVRLHAARNCDRLRLAIHNSGTPIPFDRRHSIFFSQPHANHPDTVDGWGLGLPFVRRVARNHGGSVWVDGTADDGNTFVIDMPIDCRLFAP